MNSYIYIADENINEKKQYTNNFNIFEYIFEHLRCSKMCSNVLKINRSINQSINQYTLRPIQRLLIDIDLWVSVIGEAVYMQWLSPPVIPQLWLLGFPRAPKHKLSYAWILAYFNRYLVIESAPSSKTLCVSNLGNYWPQIMACCMNGTMKFSENMLIGHTHQMEHRGITIR